MVSNMLKYVKGWQLVVWTRQLEHFTLSLYAQTIEIDGAKQLANGE